MHATDVPVKHSDHDLCSDTELSIFEGTGERIKAQFIDLIKNCVKSILPSLDRVQYIVNFQSISKRKSFNT